MLRARISDPGPEQPGYRLTSRDNTARLLHLSFPHAWPTAAPRAARALVASGGLLHCCDSVPAALAALQCLHCAVALALQVLGTDRRRAKSPAHFKWKKPRKLKARTPLSISIS